MKISIRTADVKELNRTIKKKIDEELETWESRTDNLRKTVYFHSTKSGQWEEELFLKPFIDNNNNLNFYITNIEGEKLEFEPEHGYLIGRFTEILIAHFSEKFSHIKIY